MVNCTFNILNLYCVKTVMFLNASIPMNVCMSVELFSAFQSLKKELSIFWPNLFKDTVEDHLW